MGKRIFKFVPLCFYQRLIVRQNNENENHSMNLYFYNRNIKTSNRKNPYEKNIDITSKWEAEQREKCRRWGNNLETNSN